MHLKMQLLLFKVKVQKRKKYLKTMKCDLQNWTCLSVGLFDKELIQRNIWKFEDSKLELII